MITLTHFARVCSCMVVVLYTCFFRRKRLCNSLSLSLLPLSTLFIQGGKVLVACTCVQNYESNKLVIATELHLVCNVKRLYDCVTSLQTGFYNNSNFKMVKEIMVSGEQLQLHG